MDKSSQTITLSHGSGGQVGHELVQELFVRYFANDTLAELNDAATLLLPMPSARIAFTTDSYVIAPLFFPGGDIGKLAVCGTVNDLAVSGARPLYLSAGFILEEGLPLDTLQRVVASMAEAARTAGVQIVTGDTKVVDRGAADGLFINTAGVGVFEGQHPLTPGLLQPGDAILVNGTIGDHGMAIMIQREGLAFDSPLASDCAPLNDLIAGLLTACPGSVHCMRDPTRGGIATTLNEWAAATRLGIEIKETAIPLREQVRGACEFLGLDPLYVANEGKVVIATAPEAAQKALNTLRQHPLGQDAAIIGRVTGSHPGRVTLRTPLGAQRILAMLVDEQLPRIC